MVRKDLVLAVLASKSWAQEAVEKGELDPRLKRQYVELLKKESGGAFENLPSVSVSEDDMVFLEFLSEPGEVVEKDNMRFRWAQAELLVAHEGYDREKAKGIQCKPGDKVRINLVRHASLWRGIERFLPVTGKRFCIGIVGKYKPKKKGVQEGFDYRIVQLE